MNRKDQVNAVLREHHAGQVCLDCLCRRLHRLTRAEIWRMLQEMRTDRRSYVSEYEDRCSVCHAPTLTWACD